MSIHCGSRGLGHQIGSEFLKRMAVSATGYGLTLPERELACAPINSPLGEAYLGAMRAAINCAFANRQIITHLVRKAFAQILPKAELSLLYDVSHNTCKVESHQIDGTVKRLFVHRKGATRAFGPGHPDLPAVFASIGQPVLIGGTMGTASYILVGTGDSLARMWRVPRIAIGTIGWPRSTAARHPLNPFSVKRPAGISSRPASRTAAPSTGTAAR